MTAALSAIILAATAFALPNEVVARAKKQGCPVAGGAPTDVVVARAGKAAGGKPVCPVAPVDPAPVPAPDAPVVVARAGGNKPVTAVASAKISVYNSFQCTSNTTPPPATSASDPNVSTFTLSEARQSPYTIPSHPKTPADKCLQNARLSTCLLVVQLPPRLLLFQRQALQDVMFRFSLNRAVV